MKKIFGRMQLLYGDTDKYGIYQLKDMAELRDFHFAGMAELLKIDHSADHRGHSLSVSDIVVLHENGENSPCSLFCIATTFQLSNTD